MINVCRSGSAFIPMTFSEKDGSACMKCGIDSRIGAPCLHGPASATPV